MNIKKSKVVFLGLGYIGLPTAALIAKNNINVIGVDINEKVVETINQGKIHIVEPDLDGLVKHVVENGMLRAQKEPEPADVFVIAVPTPFKGDHEPDISFVENATQSVIPYLKEGNLFIIESTSPVGTTEKMAEIIYHERPELKGKIYIAYCPERVLPGNVIYELENNDRVIGGIDEVSTVKATEFYGTFVKSNLHPTNARTAEMCKLTENSFRDVNIAFANELSLICHKAGINVWELIKLANMHPRVNILWPGTGVGGHCIAIDPWFIVSDFPNEAKIIRIAREINNYKPLWVIEQIKKAINEFSNKYNKRPYVALMGLAFKPDIDDLRESPALEVVEHLVNDKSLAVNFFINEPNVEHYKEYNNVDYLEAYKKADIVVFLVAHKQYKLIEKDLSKIELDFCGVRK
ncbi:UDP-N-acetyl-D-mannosamine dehydrogenase [Tenuifilum thalassicum]|uniref:UDP-N-acetyl-D-mannosamine dehydrogenase n=1 Tax=Tenuifilum thalassicum TaxID=2590900 RepID=A0A7D3XMH9_9BACT|nr:UDP-N-acetyl-D-mannosamine dehydrogenase [Tenuifilum thalassicum]QKG80236.1 UDP-N-acetyl-D-mannosamine dehydrogenase [Tenuifilum thalassicum]